MERGGSLRIHLKGLCDLLAHPKSWKWLIPLTQRCPNWKQPESSIHRECKIILLVHQDKMKEEPARDGETEPMAKNSNLEVRVDAIVLNLSENCRQALYHALPMN
ncbi:hypothetical protein POM88_025622 [Heracleum sosnowskyi]|uniref:Uncharacterized protein n=1 Tax=Heracleum sosnowskyi TaxID=360622 RepID=A0AAD8I4X3_9APIA|nr:hypothetical protein POM88_025622 [Heracleum sosnowskyi]